MATSKSPPAAAQPLPLLQAAAAFFVALKLAYFLFLPPIGDEAYYWLWGQHLQLSYLDHPPLHAWLLGLVSHLLGWNIFSLRILTWLSFAGTVWIIRLWSKRLAPDDWQHWFWAALCIYLASPLMLVMGSISFHDHLLIVLCLASAHFFLTFAERWQHDRPGFTRLYLAALFLGLAVLTKYNGVFLGVGYLGFIALHRDFRPLLRRWQTYLAGAISIVLQAPVIYWNLTNGLASLRFHAVDRWQGAIDIDPAGLGVTILTGVLVLSVFLVVPLLRLYRPADGDFEHLARWLAGAVLALSTAGVLVLATLENGVNAYWNIVAYPLALPLTVRTVTPRLIFWLHMGFGAVFSTAFLVDFAVTPITPYFGMSDLAVYSNYDWGRIASIVANAHAQQPDSFLAATRYTTAAQLAFALHDSEVTSIAAEPSEFGYWFDAKSHIGQNALILAAPFIPIIFAATQFHRVSLLETITIERFGQTLGSYQLYRAENYCGGACQ